MVQGSPVQGFGADASVPLDEPLYNATIKQALTRVWRKPATFSGRASRSEYWWWILIATAVSTVLQLMGSIVFGGGLFAAASPRPDFTLRTLVVPLAPAWVWALVTLVPTLSLAVRRLHDTNRSGWWYLLTIPPLIGLPLQLVGVFSFDRDRVAAGDLSGIAVGPLVAGSVLTLIGTAASVVLLIFLALPPNPDGRRFDRN